MKIIVTAATPSLDAEFEPRFGRAAYFIIFDTNTQQWEAHSNASANASGGAGTQAAMFVSNHKIEAVISGNFGPNASSALNAAGVSMYIYNGSGNIKDIIEHFKAGDLEQVKSSTISGFHRPRGRG